MALLSVSLIPSTSSSGTCLQSVSKGEKMLRQHQLQYAPAVEQTIRI